MSSRFQIPCVKFFFKAALVGLFSATLLPDNYAYLITDTLEYRVQIALGGFLTYFGLMLLLWLAFEDYLHVKDWLLAGLIGALLYTLSVGLILNVIPEPEPPKLMVIFGRLFTGAIGAIPIAIVLRSQFPRWYLWIAVNSLGCLFLQFFFDVLLWSYRFQAIGRLFFDSFLVGHLVSNIVWGIARILFSLALGMVLYWMIKTKASSSRSASIEDGSAFGGSEVGLGSQVSDVSQVPAAKFFFKAALVGLFSVNLLAYYSAGLSGHRIPMWSAFWNFEAYFALVLLIWLAFENDLRLKNWIFAGLVGGLLYALSAGVLLDVLSDKPSNAMFIFERLFSGAISAVPLGLVLRSRFSGWRLWIIVSSIGCCLLSRIFATPFLKLPYLIDLGYRGFAIDAGAGIARILFSLILSIGLYWTIKTESLKEPLRKPFGPPSLDT